MPSTSYSPFWNPYTLRDDRSGLEREFFRLARRTRKTRKLLDTLLGATSGSNATLTNKRVSASRTEQGGVRPIETRTVINRNTSAADVTHLKNMFSKVSKIATPTNKAGSYKI